MSLFVRLKAIKDKKENKELILQSLLALTVRVGGAGASFLMNVVVARYLGATEAGYFFLSVTITTLLATVGRIGADQTVLRFVSIYSDKNEWDKVKAILQTITKWSFIPLVLIAACVCIFSGYISSNIFHKEALKWPLFWAALSMPFFAAYNIYGMALQGRKKVMLSVSSLKILTPFFLILIVILVSPKDSASTSVFYLIACVLNLAVAYFWWKRNSAGFAGKGMFDKSILWQSCFPLWIMSIMQQIVWWGGQLIAGVYNSPQEVAQLSVARNTAVLITFVLTAVNYVSAPRFATLYNEGKLGELKRYARKTSMLMTIAALPFLVFVWFFPDVVMGLFGKEFTSGIWLLRILALGQFINVSTGSVGYLLIMSGHEKDLRNITIINGAIAIVLAFVLNIYFGVIGSAISTAVAIASSNIMAVGIVKKRLGFNTLSILGLK